MAIVFSDDCDRRPIYTITQVQYNAGHQCLVFILGYGERLLLNNYSFKRSL